MISVIAALALTLDVTAARPVPRGTVLTADDLIGQAAEIDLFIGLEARRPLFAGRKVTARDLAAPNAVSRQSSVTVLFVRGPLTLRTEGRAMDSGQIGESIDVLLPGRRQPIVATITRVGTVEVH